MKFLILLCAMLFTVPSMAGNSYTRHYTNVFVNDLDKQMADSFIDRLVECAEDGKTSCELKLNKATAEKMQDFLTLQHKIDSDLTKTGLKVDTSKVVECSIKVKSLIGSAKIRKADEKNEKIVFNNLFRQSANWSDMCLKKVASSINIEERISYDADIVHDGAPMAMSEEYYQELMNLVQLFHDNFRMNYEVKSFPVAVQKKRQKVFSDKYEKYWEVEYRNVPVKINYATK